MWSREGREIVLRIAVQADGVGGCFFNLKTQRHEKLSLCVEKGAELGHKHGGKHFGGGVPGGDKDALKPLRLMGGKPLEKGVLVGKLKAMIDPLINKAMPAPFCFGERQKHVGVAIEVVVRIIGPRAEGDGNILIMTMRNGAPLAGASNKPMAHAVAARKYQFRACCVGYGHAVPS